MNPKKKTTTPPTPAPPPESVWSVSLGRDPLAGLDVPRIAAALAALKSDAPLWGELRACVERFYADHPAEPRTDQTTALLLVLFFAALTAAAERGAKPAPASTGRAAA